MKLKSLCIMLLLLFLLVGCSGSTADDGTIVAATELETNSDPEGNILNEKNAEIYNEVLDIIITNPVRSEESLLEEIASNYGMTAEQLKQFLNDYKEALPAPDSTPSVSYDDRMSELDAEAELMAANAKSIESGDIYNAVTSIYENVKLVDMGGTLSVDFYLNSVSPQTDSEAFFYLVKRLITECNLESEYDSLSFSMHVDDSFVTMFSVLRYYGPDSYTSVEPLLVMDDNYEEYIFNLYNDYFLSNDANYKFSQELQIISEKYGIE